MCGQQSSTIGIFYQRKRLGKNFYDATSEELSKNLLGKILVRRFNDGTFVRGRIVETESFAGGEDMSSRLYSKKAVLQNEMESMTPGTTFVHTAWGGLLYLNIVSRGCGAAVLLRAIEPLENLDIMITLWEKHVKKSKGTRQIKDLCNSPTKLCVSYGIDLESCSKQDLISGDMMWLEEDDESNLANTIICAPRLGINSRREFPMKLLRFYIEDNLYVSKIVKSGNFEVD